MKLLIFTEGTILMHAAGESKTPAERIQQVKEQDPSVKDYASYVPVGNASAVLAKWAGESVEVTYLTSRRQPDDIAQIQTVLRRYSFPKGELFSRQGNESSRDVVKQVRPDVYIEDDCASIGGHPEMTFCTTAEAAKNCVRQIVVPEFSGIDEILLP